MFAMLQFLCYPGISDMLNWNDYQFIPSKALLATFTNFWILIKARRNSPFPCNILYFETLFEQHSLCSRLSFECRQKYPPTSVSSINYKMTTLIRDVTIPASDNCMQYINMLRAQERTRVNGPCSFPCHSIVGHPRVISSSTYQTRSPLGIRRCCLSFVVEYIYTYLVLKHF
jgi:hypothetical protein